MAPLKVLFINPYISSAYGGISHVVLALAAALGEQGIEVDLITTNASVNQKLNVPLNTWLQQGSYRIQYFPCWHKNDFIVSKSMLLWLHTNAPKYSFIHTHTAFSPLISLCQWICHLNKIPYVVTPHGMLEPWALSYKSCKKKLYFSGPETWNISRSSLIQGISRAEIENISHLFPKSNIKLIPNGIDLSSLRSSCETEKLLIESFPGLVGKRLILFLGRIDPKKGLDLLASAFAQVRQHTPNAHLIVAGPDNIGYLPRAKQYFAEASCLESVTFTGMLTGEIKACALDIAEVYVSPSYSEGFSMSVLEGMASGLPCVITTGCNFPEAAQANAAKVVDIQADAIAQALIDCLSDPLTAKAMGDRARQFVLDHYTWDRVAAQLIEVYTDILTVPSESPLA